MKTIGAYAVLVAAVPVIFAGVVATRGQGPDVGQIEKAILAVSDEMTQAGESVDADRLLAHMLDTDKGSVIQNGVFMSTRHEALERTKADMQGVGKLAYRWKRRHVTVLSAESALLTAEGESVATLQDGRVFTTTFAQSIVFVRRDGQWKAIHAHHSSPR